MSGNQLYSHDTAAARRILLVHFGLVGLATADGGGVRALIQATRLLLGRGRLPLVPVLQTTVMIIGRRPLLLLLSLLLLLQPRGGAGRRAGPVARGGSCTS